MEGISRIGTTSQIQDDSAGPEVGLLDQVQNHLIGNRASRWLNANKDVVFQSVDRAIDQTVRLQSEIQSILSDMELGIYPTRTVVSPVDGSETEQTLDRVATLKLAVDLLRDVIPMVDKVVATRQKVASGGGNLMTAAMLTSNQIRMNAARNQERSVSPRRPVGVGKLVIPADDAVVDAE